MFIIDLLQDWVIHAILFAGIAGIIFSFFLEVIPFVKLYELPIRVCSLLLLVVGVYLEGGIACNKKWELKVKDLEIKLAKAEAQSAQVNTTVVTEYVTKTKLVKEKGNEVIKYVDREITKYDKSCIIPEAVKIAHNTAALNNTK